MRTLLIILAISMASCTNVKVQTELGIVHELDIHKYYDLVSVGDTIIIQSDGSRYVGIHGIYTGRVPEYISGKYYHASKKDSIPFYIAFSKAVIVSK
jgi:hypothetical protein